MTGENESRSQFIGIDLSSLGVDSLPNVEEEPIKEFKTVNLFDGIDELASNSYMDKEQSRNESLDEEKESSDCDSLNLAQNQTEYSFYLTHNPKDKKGLISKFITSIMEIEMHLIDSFGDAIVTKEMKREDILNILQVNNHLDLASMAIHIGNRHEYGMSIEGQKEYIKSLCDGKASKGTADVEKFDMRVDYRIDENNIVHFDGIKDFHAYKEDEINIVNVTGDWEKVGLDFVNAIADVYPILSKGALILDFKAIVDSMRANTGLKYTLRDTIEIIKMFIRSGWLTNVDTRINNGHEDYKQVFIINNNKIPVLGEYGRCVSYIEIEEKVINSYLSLFNTRWNINVPCFPKTTWNTFTLSSGLFGILCNGIFVGIKRNNYSINGNMKFDLYRIENKQKSIRFNKNYRLKKAINPNAKDVYDEDKFKEKIEVKLIQKNIKTSESIMSTLTANVGGKINLDGGLFAKTSNSTDVNNGLMYDKDTLWEDFISEDKLYNETDSNYYKRLQSIDRLKTRLSRTMKIEGMHMTSEAVKYAKSYINDLNNIDSYNISPSLNKEGLLKMEVYKIVNLDMLYTFEKSMFSANNESINRAINEFKEVLTVVAGDRQIFKYKEETRDGDIITITEHMNKRGMNPELLEDENKYMCKSVNDNIIQEYINRYKEKIEDEEEIDEEVRMLFEDKEKEEKEIISDEDKEKIKSEIAYLKKIKKIKVYKDKCNELAEWQKHLESTGLNDNVTQDAMKSNMYNTYEWIKCLYNEEKNKYDNVIEVLKNFKYADKLQFKTKKKLFNFVEKYNKATGNNLEIQNFKVEVIDLTSNIISENNNIIKDIKEDIKNEIVDKTEGKELKSLETKYNKSLKRLRRILKKDIYGIRYNDYNTLKTKIKVDVTCNKIIELTNSILNSTLKSNYICEDMEVKMNLLNNHLQDIISNKYEIADDTIYSKDIFSLSNVCISINPNNEGFRYGRHGKLRYSYSYQY